MHATAPRSTWRTIKFSTADTTSNDTMVVHARTAFIVMEASVGCPNRPWNSFNEGWDRSRRTSGAAVLRKANTVVYALMLRSGGGFGGPRRAPVSIRRRRQPDLGTQGAATSSPVLPCSGPAAHAQQLNRASRSATALPRSRDSAPTRSIMRPLPRTSPSGDASADPERFEEILADLGGVGHEPLAQRPDVRGLRRAAAGPP